MLKENEGGAGMDVVRDSSGIQDSETLRPVSEGQRQGRLGRPWAEQHRGNTLAHLVSSPPTHPLLFPGVLLENITLHAMPLLGQFTNSSSRRGRPPRALLAGAA